MRNCGAGVSVGGGSTGGSAWTAGGERESNHCGDVAGHAACGQHDLRLVVDVSRDEKGGYKVVTYSIDPNPRLIPADTASF